MLSLNTVLISVLGGFIFVKYCYFTRFRSIRDNGYVILFKSAVVGVSFYVIAFFLWRVAILDEDVNPKISEGIEKAHFFFGVPEAVPAIMSVILMGMVLGIINFVLDKDEMKKRVIRQDDDSFEMTLLRAYENDKEVLITLDNGKIYVGRVTDTYFRINDEIRSVLITPYLSGYRKPSDHTIELTTFYGDIYNQILENPDQFNVKISDFSVSIRYDHIVSVSPFDPETFVKFREV